MNDSDLDQLLNAGGTPARTPAGFQRDVWSRIEVAEAAGWQAHMHQHIERCLGFLALPSVAVATCAAMVMAGAWFGMESRPQNPSAEVAYVQSVSPFSNSHH